MPYTKLNTYIRGTQARAESVEGDFGSLEAQWRSLLEFPDFPAAKAFPENAATRANKLFGFDDDGNPEAVPVSSVAGVQVFRPESAIINGNFPVWQRGASFPEIGSDAVSADTWDNGQAGGQIKIDVDQSTSVPTPSDTAAVSQYSMRLTVSTPETAVATSDFVNVFHKAEGYNALRFGFGKLGAKSMTVSFWVWSSLAGTYTVGLNNAAQDRAYVHEYTIDAPNTWEKKSFSLTADTTGTWLTTNGVGLILVWAMSSGSAQAIAGATDTWLGESGKWTTTNINNAWMTTNGATFALSQVQVNLGSAASPFEHVDFGVELARCQRYYCKTFPYIIAPAQATGNGTGAVAYLAHANGIVSDGMRWTYPVQMRTQPTVTMYSINSSNTTWRNGNLSADSGASGTANGGDNGIFITNAQVSGDLVGHILGIHADADAGL